MSYDIAICLLWIVVGTTMGVLWVRHGWGEDDASSGEAGLMVLTVILLAPLVAAGAVLFGVCWLIGRLALLGQR